jgi:hypothetical protein
LRKGSRSRRQYKKKTRRGHTARTHARGRDAPGTRRRLLTRGPSPRDQVLRKRGPHSLTARGHASTFPPFQKTRPPPPEEEAAEGEEKGQGPVPRRWVVGPEGFTDLPLTRGGAGEAARQGQFRETDRGGGRGLLD